MVVDIDSVLLGYLRFVLCAGVIRVRVLLCRHSTLALNMSVDTTDVPAAIAKVATNPITLDAAPHTALWLYSEASNPTLLTSLTKDSAVLLSSAEPPLQVRLVTEYPISPPHKPAITIERVAKRRATRDGAYDDGMCDDAGVFIYKLKPTFYAHYRVTNSVLQTFLTFVSLCL